VTSFLMEPGIPTIDDALGPLIETLREGADPAVRAFAALTLAKCGRSAVLAPLVAALGDTEKVVRRAAAQSLAGIGPEAVPVLVAALGDPSWIVRYRAAEALGMIRDPRAAPALIGMLGDPEDHVRFMAAKGLALDPGGPATDALIGRLDDRNPYVRRMAAEALRNAPTPLGDAVASRIRELSPGG